MPLPRRFLAMGVAVALFSAACEYDPTILDGPLGDCGGDTANRGYGYDPNRDPAGGSSYSGTSASDVIIAANGPVRISAGAGHDVICANPLGRTSSVVIDAGPGLDDCRNVSGVTTSGCEFVDGIPNVNAVNTALGRGINLGNILEAPREGAWGLELEAGFFTKIAQQGFTHVRVPISWAGYARSTPPYDIPDDNDPTIAHPDYDSIFERVDWVIEQADATGLIAIINMHHYDAIHENPLAEAPRLLAMWDEIATRYADAGHHVLFELLNEPHGAFDTNPTLWNDLLADTLDVVRDSNPTRPVLVGPVGYNGIARLDDLVLPPDPYLITTVHFYDPFPFTHQGAEWVSPTPPVGVTWDADRLGFDTDVEDYSWSTSVTTTTTAMLVDYAEQYAGFAPHLRSPIDPTTLSFRVAGAASLRIGCTSDSGGDITIRTLTTTTTARTYSFDTSMCPSATTGVYFQNNNTTGRQLAFSDITLCSNAGCDDFIDSGSEAVEERIGDAATWGIAQRRPMHIGEFGAYSAGGTAPLAARAEWTAAVQQAAANNAISSSYWEFAAGFGVYDPSTDRWIEPLLDALVG